MKPLGLRDVIGPIMIGPSSSHTAGACRIALMARSLLSAPPCAVEFVLYGSFAHTYRGHGTDRALTAGILGCLPDDERLREAFDLAADMGVDVTISPDTVTEVTHPNTVDVRVRDERGDFMEVRGVSIGGGAAKIVRIDGIDVDVTGAYHNMIVYQDDAPGVLAHITACLSGRGVNIGTVRLHRTEKAGDAFTVLELDDVVSDEVIARILEFPAIKSVRFIPAPSLSRPADAITPVMYPASARKTFQQLDFANAEELLAYCREEGVAISRAFADREEALMSTRPAEEVTTEAYLDHVLQVMRASATRPLSQAAPSMGGLIGGEAQRVAQLGDKGLLSPLFWRMSAYALAVMETNASMGCIVAAPTAGSSGVLPAVLMALQDTFSFSHRQMRDAVLNAGAIGYLITRNATVAGAEGGCQAEIGSASAMAASAAAELMGASPAACLHAASTAISNTLGMVCDPIGGLVEAPCQMRNASAASNALIAAQCALAGIAHIAPFDETVDAMYRVGRALPAELRETALGGMATCPSCMAFNVQLSKA
ncbi:L-serine ammonia-lyase, iron-sulfur-dependent, subunit alpha [Berryella wangjianweii]|uniref:L-serine dehydratase n=1 Tax=Berryella wangjianweii TaxID=2734634 RepID=A0A6M8IYS7_9ACTN|nr:L-serine ammonia-lyase, iron-sulfur-dependent, subunit alpha [Berryella wangjianweii]QKF06860.1 L-serine ammonia-lyase, iron-sulfur-dependent, subunit alpha [Berryella wangjianweii]